MNHQVSAIIAAAGSSTRMGRLKQLLPVAGKPMLHRAVEAFRAAGLGEVLVVVSPAHGPVVDLVVGLPVGMVLNHNPGSDMAQSFRAGLAAVSAAATGILFHPGDCPLVRPETIRRLAELHGEERELILVPRCGSRNGHPVLFPAFLARDLLAGGTLRELVRRHEDRRKFVPVPDEGILTDIDTPADYARIAGSS